MKILIYIFTTVIYSLLSAVAQDINVICDLLTKTEIQIPEKYRYPSAITEMSSSLEKIESFVEMQSILRNSWKKSLPLLNELTANDTQKALYFKAAQILPREEYIDFVTAASEQVSTGIISKQQFTWTLFPSEKHLREMWIEDPPSESLLQLARRAKMVLGDNAGQSSFFDNVLSGKVASDNRYLDLTNRAEKVIEGQLHSPKLPTQEASERTSEQQVKSTTSRLAAVERTRSYSSGLALGLVAILIAMTVVVVIFLLRRKST